MNALCRKEFLLFVNVEIYVNVKIVPIFSQLPIMNKNLTVINLFGAPGSAKSTTSSGIFYELKKASVSCELITEYAKQLVFESRNITLGDQLYITAKQNHRLATLVGRVDTAISDSPLLQALAYTPDTYYENYFSLVKEVFESYNNINFFLNRAKSYSTIGRSQSEAESNILGLRIKNLLTNNNIPFLEIDGDDLAVSKIMYILNGKKND
jgi:hypothetical protein